MKRVRNLIILAAVLVVVVVAIIVIKGINKKQEEISSTYEVIFSVDADQVTAVNWEYEDTALSFAKDGDIWTDSSDSAFPVSQSKIGSLLNNFSEVYATFIIEDVDDFEQYGLSDPEYKLTFETSDGEISLEMGDYSVIDSQRYVSTGDGNVYLAETDPVEYLTAERDDYMQNDEITDFDVFSEISISGNSDIDIVRDDEEVYTYTDAFIYYLLDDGEHLPVSASSASELIGTFTGLTLSDYVTYDASNADLSEYGLDNPAYTVSLYGQVLAEDEAETEEETETESETSDDADSESAETETETETESVTYDEEELEDASCTIYIGYVAKDDEDESGSAFARVADSEIIYAIDVSVYEELQDATETYLRPSTVLSLDWDKVTGIDFTLDGKSYSVEISPKDEDEITDDDDSEYKYVIGDSEVDFEDAKACVDALAMSLYDDSVSAKTLELTFTVHLDNEDYPELIVNIYQYDGDYCVVQVNVDTLGLMDRSTMANLREAFTSIVLNL